MTRRQDEPAWDASAIELTAVVRHPLQNLGAFSRFVGAVLCVYVSLALAHTTVGKAVGHKLRRAFLSPEQRQLFAGQDLSDYSTHTPGVRVLILGDSYAIASSSSDTEGVYGGETFFHMLQHREYKVGSLAEVGARTGCLRIHPLAVGTKENRFEKLSRRMFALEPVEPCTSRWGAECVDHQARRARGLRPDVVVYWAGTNDIFDGSNTYLEDWRRPADTVLNETGARLFVVTPPAVAQEVFEFLDMDFGSFDGSRKELSRCIREYATRSDRVVLLDAEELVSSSGFPPFIGIEGKHLNFEGHKALTRLIETLLD